MTFNFKYLILPLSILACIDNYEVNAMEDGNPNKIMKNNIGDDSTNNNHNKSEINDQKNNEFLQIEIDNENDKEKIKELVTQPLEDIPSVQFLIAHTHGMLALTKTLSHRSGFGEKQKYVRYYRYGILNLLKSFNSWNPNKQLTIDQLTAINNVIKTVYFFVQRDKEYKKLNLIKDKKYKKSNLEQTFGMNITEYMRMKNYNFAFSVEDEFFGIGLSKEDNDNEYYKCIFIQPNSNGLFAVQNCENTTKKSKKKCVDNKSFRNFIDAVKLCSTKKLPISFIDKNGIKHNNSCLITNNEYENLLVVLMKDFWNAFHGEYKYDLLRLSKNYPDYYTMEIKSVEEYEKIKQKDKKTYEEKDALDRYNKNIMLQKIKKAFEDEYDEKNFIEIFGEETINNIRYIIHHLIDIEINNNHELFEDTLDEILSKENNLYGTMRKSETKGKALIDKLVKELKNDENLEKHIYKKVWTDNIVLPEDKNIFKQLGKEKDQYKLSSKQRVENYLKKLFYDKTLDNYLRNNLFKYIIGSNALITDIHKNPSGTQEDRDLVKEKHIENIKSSYILRNILEYIKDSNRLKKGLFFNKKEDKNDKISNKINSNNNKCSDKFDTNNNKINDISDYNNSNKFD